MTNWVDRHVRKSVDGFVNEYMKITSAWPLTTSLRTHPNVCDKNTMQISVIPPV